MMSEASLVVAAEHDRVAHELVHAQDLVHPEAVVRQRPLDPQLYQVVGEQPPAPAAAEGALLFNTHHAANRPRLRNAYEWTS